MIEWIEAVATGQYKILFWFVLAILFIYIPSMWIYLNKRKEKWRLYEHNHPNAVKVYFRFDLIGTIEVYSVNGEEPVHFYETTRQGIYLLPEENTIGVQYYWSEKDMYSLKGYTDYNVAPRKMKVTVEEGNTYSIGYNHDKKKIEFKDGKNG